MTGVKTPIFRLTKVGVLSIGLIIVSALAVAVPTTLYWATQRTELHSRWQIEANYARQFSFQMDDSLVYLNGTLIKWSNVTSGFVGELMGDADANLNLLTGYDTDHANQLIRISYSIESIQPSFYMNPNNINATYRATLGNQLYSLDHKILYAYWNFLNYTSVGGTAGPPFWYSGPSSPDEHLLQDAVNIALALHPPT